MLRLIMSYQCLVWGHASTTKKSVRKILNTIQRKSLLGITHTFRSTPTVGMEAVLGIAPMDIYIKEQVTKSR
uniref:Uncharacterized protein n=1 Tax=Lepeophtheirus salmonis TaxID=72036 RepID=A0A0K2SVH6_LEPSM